MHFDWEVKAGWGREAHHETRHRHFGLDCIHQPTQAEAILDHGQASVSLCALGCMSSQEELVVWPSFRSFEFLCEKVSLGLKRDYIYI